MNTNQPSRRRQFATMTADDLAEVMSADIHRWGWDTPATLDDLDQQHARRYRTAICWSGKRKPNPHRYLAAKIDPK